MIHINRQNQEFLKACLNYVDSYFKLKSDSYKIC